MWALTLWTNLHFALILPVSKERKKKIMGEHRGGMLVKEPEGDTEEPTEKLSPS